MILKYILEIKYRFFFIFFSFIFSLIISYLYKEYLLLIILKPVYKNSNLINNLLITNVSEIFNSYLIIIFYISLFLNFFFALMHVLLFIKSGLYTTELNNVIFFLFLNFFFIFFFGCFFYFYIIPISWLFLYSYSFFNYNVKIIFELKLSEHLNFIIYFIKLWFILSEIFTIIIYYIYFSNYKLNKIKKNKKFVFFVTFTLSAFITPPDIFSQLIVGFLFFFIFEIFIFFYLFVNNINKATN